MLAQVLQMLEWVYGKQKLYSNEDYVTKLAGGFPSAVKWTLK